MEKERLQKVMAQAGIASRRKCEEYILAGRVKVNGELVKELGTKVSKKDLIEVDDKPLTKESKVYFLMNKPKQSMCTSNDEFHRQTVVSLIDCSERIFTVGRLDYDTSGVLLLTNDGEFANMVIHPKFHLPKIYNLTINGILTTEDKIKIKKGIVLDDGYQTMPAKFKLTEIDKKKNQCSFDLTIYEGKNHQVKRMMQALGYEVRRLHRKQLSFLHCSDLRQGEYRKLKPFEIKQLKSLSAKGKAIE